MWVKSLTLYNFRNYTERRFEFTNSLNVITGKNAQGKTNLVEALYFCSIGKSFRTSKESDLINFNAEKARVKIVVEDKSGEKEIEILFNRHSKKIIRINDLNILKIASLLGNLLTVFFNPDELKLIKDAPQDRRKFMDIAISQLSKKYFYLLLKYQKILQERNNLLKKSKDLETLKNTISIWNEQLAETAKQIIFQRLAQNIKYIPLVNA